MFPAAVVVDREAHLPAAFGEEQFGFGPGLAAELLHRADAVAVGRAELVGRVGRPDQDAGSGPELLFPDLAFGREPGLQVFDGLPIRGQVFEVEALGDLDLAHVLDAGDDERLVLAVHVLERVVASDGDAADVAHPRRHRQVELGRPAEHGRAGFDPYRIRVALEEAEGVQEAEDGWADAVQVVVPEAHDLDAELARAAGPRILGPDLQDLADVHPFVRHGAVREDGKAGRVDRRVHFFSLSGRLLKVWNMRKYHISAKMSSPKGQVPGSHADAHQDRDGRSVTIGKRWREDGILTGG